MYQVIEMQANMPPTVTPFPYNNHAELAADKYMAGKKFRYYSKYGGTLDMVSKNVIIRSSFVSLASGIKVEPAEISVVSECGAAYEWERCEWL